MKFERKSKFYNLFMYSNSDGCGIDYNFKVS